MSDLSIELQRLREQDNDLALIIDAFAVIDDIYRASLRAMGQAADPIPAVKNSAEVTLSVNASTSTASRTIASSDK